MLPLLGGAFLAQGVLRFVLSLGQTTPIFIPDESGYLLAARLFGGGTAGDLSGQRFYQAGYPLLISPVYWFTSDPELVYRIVLGINAFIGALLVLIAFQAAVRLGLPRRSAFVLAQLTALLPGQVYYTQGALTDAILPTVVFGWLLLVHTWLRRDHAGYGLAATALSAYAFCTHSRGVILLVLQAVLVCVVHVRGLRNERDGQSAHSTLLSTALVLFGGLAWGVNWWLRERLYPAGTLALAGELGDRLTSWNGLLWTVSLTAGKLWYLIVSTWGIAGLGLVALVAVLADRRTAWETRVTGWALLVSTTCVAVGFSAAISDEGSVANNAYGRYLSCFVPALFVAGGAAMLQASTARLFRGVLAVSALAAGSAGIVRLLSGDRLRTAFFGPFDFPEITFLTWNWSAFELWEATWTALLLLVLAAAAPAAFGRRRGLPLAASGLALVSLAGIAVSTIRVTHFWAKTLGSQVSLKAAGLRADDRVAIGYQGMSWRVWVSQAFQVSSGLIPFDHRGRVAPAEHVTLIVVPWDGRRPPQRTWPAARPGWHVVAALNGAAGGWAAWRRVG